MLKTLGSWMLVAMLACAVPAAVDASGGSGGGGGGGGGGSTKPLEIRVTGYVTAIDYDLGIITVGASYYNTGTAWVTGTTKISINNSSTGTLDDIAVGDWCEMRYDYYTKIATKLSVTVPSI